MEGKGREILSLISKARERDEEKDNDTESRGHTQTRTRNANTQAVRKRTSRVSEPQAQHSVRVDGALGLGRVVLLVCESNRMAHFLACRLHLVGRVAGVVHGAAHGHEPLFEQGPGPLDVALPVAEPENAGNVVWVVLLIAHKLESDGPRPAHTNKHKAGRGEYSVHVSVVCGQRVIVDRVKGFPIHTAATMSQSAGCLLVAQ